MSLATWARKSGHSSFWSVCPSWAHRGVAGVVTWATCVAMSSKTGLLSYRHAWSPGCAYRLVGSGHARSRYCSVPNRCGTTACATGKSSLLYCSRLELFDTDVSGWSASERSRLAAARASRRWIFGPSRSGCRDATH